MQQSWRKYVECVKNLCSDEFWDIFKVVNAEKGNCADAVLKEVKKLLKMQSRVCVCTCGLGGARVRPCTSLNPRSTVHRQDH